MIADTQQYPVFITTRDRLSPLLQLIDWFQSVGQHEIYLIDNDSSYPPLLDFFERTDCQVIRLDRNIGHRAPWLTGMVHRIARKQFYVVSDPDVVPDENCPSDCLGYLKSVLLRFPEMHKVGLGLRIDDLPEHFPMKSDVIAWERRFWRNEVEKGLYRADIDTTFAMYRPLPRRSSNALSLRTGAPYLARHLPWYIDPAKMAVDEVFYRANADPAFSNWNRESTPLWKQKWLHSQDPSGEHHED